MLEAFMRHLDGKDVRLIDLFVEVAGAVSTRKLGSFQILVLSPGVNDSILLLADEQNDALWEREAQHTRSSTSSA